ncbi:quinone oxidoreductase family protein [Subtercola boreus]|uniref:quinone oxidoreductase family protein n=1 Tax=Subtercola boreus TaxID=120213 RepID=UPI001472E7DD|nr:zinc-binding dehydrogenase [Subtercola boreus]
MHDLPAAIIDRPGVEPRTGSIDLPPREPGQTLLSVAAAPLNPLDLLIASGDFHSARHEEPYVPGSECVGTVLESDSYPVGSIVYAELHVSPQAPGAFATHVLVDDHNITTLPAGIDPVQAAAVGNSGIAAYLPLVHTVGLRAGETVLVLGATGAVGQLAVQIAHLLSAGRVVGVARDRAALERLLTIGADAVVELRANEKAEQLAERIRAVSGPVDVVFDGIYGLPLEAALHVAAPRARLVNVGNLAGPTAGIPAGLLRGKQLTISGFAGIHVPVTEKQAALGWLWNAIIAAELEVAITTVTLEDLPQAWRAQAASPHTKYIVVPKQPDESENR